jgi:PhnB protein
MKDTANHSNFAPEGWHTVTPRIVAHDAEQLVEFLRQVFGATGDYRPDLPSVIKIGDSVVMVSNAGIRNARGSFLYVYVGDADATYQRALNAGARSLEEPFVTPYGDRRCMVEDKWGNTWQIATRMEARDAIQDYSRGPSNT